MSVKYALVMQLLGMQYGEPSLHALYKKSVIFE